MKNLNSFRLIESIPASFSLRRQIRAGFYFFCSGILFLIVSIFVLYQNICFSTSAPTVSSVSLNGGSNITLVENTTTLVSATGTVTDTDGYSDISSVTGKIYRSGVGNDCSADNNNCYEDSACATSSCDGNSCTATCDFNVYFYAEPTDDGIYATAQGWNTQEWIAWIKTIDSQSASSSATNTTQAVDVNTLAALIIDSSITYDALDPGQNMASTTKQIYATTTGNVPIDVQIKGDAMTYGATGTIAVTNQRYSTTINDAWASANTASSSYQTLEMDLPKPTAHPSTSTDIIYWGWQVPSGTPDGTYTGTNYFNAVED